MGWNAGWVQLVRIKQSCRSRAVNPGVTKGDMEMTMQEFYKAGISRSIRTGETLEQIANGIQPETINDMRALLEMIRFDQLPEPARTLAEKVKSRI
jgi:hypothetical protein